MADQPGGPGGPLDDPLERLDRNARSSRSAGVHLTVSVVAVAVAALLTAWLWPPSTTPCPEHGSLCTTGTRVADVLVPSLVAVVAATAAGWRCYTHWRDRVRWRAWLLVTQLLWLGAAGYLLIAASVLFDH